LSRKCENIWMYIIWMCVYIYNYIYCIYIYRDSLVKSPQWEPSIPLQRALNQTIPIYIYM
jgi:hypothetical protein